MPLRPTHPRNAAGPKPVAQCAPLLSLGARVRELDELDRRFRQALPVPLNEKLRLAGLRGNRAVLLASSPAWAARARTAVPRVLAILRSFGLQADSILVKVVSETPVSGEPVASMPPLSAASAQHLRSAAKAMSDPALRDLFLELASFAGKDSCS
ncbi:MAG: DUF721 domain-containing protein [Rhodanobacteraceae bacterium]